MECGGIIKWAVLAVVCVTCAASFDAARKKKRLRCAFPCLVSFSGVLFMFGNEKALEAALRETESLFRLAAPDYAAWAMGQYRFYAMFSLLAIFFTLAFFLTVLWNRRRPEDRAALRGYNGLLAGAMAVTLLAGTIYGVGMLSKIFELPGYFWRLALYETMILFLPLGARYAIPPGTDGKKEAQAIDRVI